MTELGRRSYDDLLAAFASLVALLAADDEAGAGG